MDEMTLMDRLAVTSVEGEPEEGLYLLDGDLLVSCFVSGNAYMAYDVTMFEVSDSTGMYDVSLQQVSDGLITHCPTALDVLMRATAFTYVDADKYDGIDETGVVKICDQCASSEDTNLADVAASLDMTPEELADRILEGRLALEDSKAQHEGYMFRRTWNHMIAPKVEGDLEKAVKGDAPLLHGCKYQLASFGTGLGDRQVELSLEVPAHEGNLSELFDEDDLFETDKQNMPIWMGLRDKDGHLKAASTKFDIYGNWELRAHKFEVEVNVTPPRLIQENVKDRPGIRR